MITSLLSLYIATTMPPEMAATSNIKSSTFDFRSFIEAPVPAPIKSPEFISPIINAESSITIDMNTGKILFEKSPHKRLSIASITKLMTVFVILEENKLNETVTVSQNAAGTEGSHMSLRTGEQIALENLLYGALIHSANDAAVALAEHNAGTVEEFVKKMNKKAQELELSNTHFSNPIGFDQQGNYSSAYDISKLAKKIYQNQFVRHAAKLQELEVRSVDKAYIHNLKSTNNLLGNDFLKFKGLKTGRTSDAGLCLVSIAENNEKNEIITVVLDSPARFTETKILVDWIFRAYNW